MDEYRDNPAYQDQDAAFADDPEVSYQPLSWLAIIALVMGLASILVLISLLVLPVAVLAVALAAIGLWQIYRSNNAVAGTWAAWGGLFFALFFSTAAIASTVHQTWNIRHRAHQLGQQWLDMVAEGKLYQAHQLTLPPHRRQSPSTALAPYYDRSEPALEDFENFFRAGPARELADAGSSGKLVYHGMYDHEERKNRDDIVESYTLTIGEGEQARRVPLHLFVSRSVQDGKARWTVRGPAAPPRNE